MGTTTNELSVQSDAAFRAAFRMEHSLGAGGGGEVFLATQVSLARPVVIKAMQRELILDETHRRRFQREAKMLAELAHARITQLYQYGIWVDRPYLAMEYVDGGSLAQLMETQGALAPREAIRIAMEIAEALAYLHERNLLHRDIKPGNILLTRNRDAKLADFGLARPDNASALTGDGLVVGTLWYIAPELLVHGEASPSTDLYSLGMVTYQMLTMRMAFTEDISDLVKLAAHRVNEDVIPIQKRDPNLPPEVCGLVNRMIAKEPDKRPKSAARLVDELASLHDALATPSRRLRRPPEEGTAQLSSEEMQKAARPRTSPGRTRATRWGLSGKAKALMLGFALAGVTAGLLIGMRMRPNPEPVIENDPRVPVAPPTIERMPKWVHVRFTSVTPGHLIVRVVPTGSSMGKVLEAESRVLHEHDVTVEPLDPRVNYQVQVKLRLPNGTEQSVGSMHAASPLQEILGLARAIEKTDVVGSLKAYDESRPLKRGPMLERVQEILERSRWRARLAALGQVPAAVYADSDTHQADLAEIYRGFAPVRELDRYCEAHGLPFRSEVEKLLPFDLSPAVPPLDRAPPLAVAALPEVRLLVPADPNSALLVDMGDTLNDDAPLYSRATESLVGTLDVPEGADKKSKVQLRVTISNVKASTYPVTLEGFPVPLQFLPPYRHAITGESSVMYHSVPPRWLRPGRIKVTVRARVSPCTQNNFVKPIPITQDPASNMPRVEDVTLLAL